MINKNQKEQMKTPTKLKKVTLVDVMTQFKFDNKQNIEDILVDVLSKLKKDGFEYKKLPIMQLPESIRDSDDKFKFQPYYSFQKDKFEISVGPKTLSMSVKGYYSGWKEYKEFIAKYLEEFDDLFRKWELNHTSMRYIDFFQNTATIDKLNLSTKLPSGLCNDKYNINRSFTDLELGCSDNYKVNIKAGHAGIKREETDNVQQGVILHIDTSCDKTNLSEVHEILEDLHKHCKEVFFSILSDELIDSLGPEY